MTTSPYTPFEVRNNDRIIGLFVIVAVLAVLVGIIIPFFNRLSEDSGLTFYTLLSETYGIVPQASVSMLGVNVGIVESVDITESGSIRVDFTMAAQYQNLYRQDSHMTVNTNIGLNTILTGSGLIFNPGEGSSLLEDGGFIRTETPQGLISMFSDVDIVELANQAADILENLETITDEFVANQGRVYQSLQNIEQLTANLSEVSRTLPDLTSTVNDTLLAVQEVVNSSDRMMTSLEGEMQPLLANAGELSEQATATLGELELLLKETRPVMEQIPLFLLTTEVTMQSVSDMSDEISNSWFLGGAGDEPIPLIPSPYARDNALYETGVQAGQGPD